MVIFDCLFGLYVFSHQSCATGALLLPQRHLSSKYRRIFLNAYKKKSKALINKPFPSLDNVRDFTRILHFTKILGWRGALAYGKHSRGRLSYKVKVPPVRIENSLSPLYRGTDFSTLAETFQTVWGEARWVNELALKPKKAHSLKKVKTIHGFPMIISKLQA